MSRGGLSVGWAELASPTKNCFFTILLLTPCLGHDTTIVNPPRAAGVCPWRMSAWPRHAGPRPRGSRGLEWRLDWARTHNLIRILFRFWAAFLGFEDTPHHFLQTTKESFVSQRPASATVPIKEVPFSVPMPFGSLKAAAAATRAHPRVVRLHKTSTTSRRARS